MATNRFKIRRGSSTPSTANLESFELGYVTGSGRLYINANGTMRQVGGTVSQATVNSSSTHDQIPTALAVYNYGNGAFLKLTGGTISGNVTITGTLLMNDLIKFGTDAVRRASAGNMLFLGQDPGIVDTVANWTAKGFGWAWITQTGQVTDQPSTYGFLLNIPINTSGTECHQMFMVQAGGAVYHRGGNNSGWASAWKQMWDSTNLPLPLGTSQGGTGRTDGKAAALVTPRKIGDANFDGSADITLEQMGAFRTYTHVSQLGFTWGEPTMNQVFAAMPANSMFMGDAGNFLASDMKHSLGILQLVKGPNTYRSYAVLWSRVRASGIWVRHINSPGTEFDTEWVPIYDGALPAIGAERLSMARNDNHTTIVMERFSLGGLSKSCYIMATNAGFEFIARDKSDASNQLQLVMHDPVSRTSINQALEFGRTVGGVTNWYQVYHTGMTNTVSKAQGGLGANVSDWNNLRNAIGVQMRSGQTSVGTSGTNVTWSALGGAPQLITVTPNGHGASYQATVSGLSASGMTINAAHSNTTVRWCVIYFP